MASLDSMVTSRQCDRPKRKSQMRSVAKSSWGVLYEIDANSFRVDTAKTPQGTKRRHVAHASSYGNSLEQTSFASWWDPCNSGHATPWSTLVDPQHGGQAGRPRSMSPLRYCTEASLCARLPGTRLRLKRLGNTRAARPTCGRLPPTQPADVCGSEFCPGSDKISVFRRCAWPGCALEVVTYLCISGRSVGPGPCFLPRSAVARATQTESATARTVQYRSHMPQDAVGKRHVPPSHRALRTAPKKLYRSDWHGKCVLIRIARSGNDIYHDSQIVPVHRTSSMRQGEFDQLCAVNNDERNQQGCAANSDPGQNETTHCGQCSFDVKKEIVKLLQITLEKNFFTAAPKTIINITAGQPALPPPIKFRRKSSSRFQLPKE